MTRFNKLFVVVFVLLIYGLLITPVNAQQEGTVAPSGPSEADIQAAEDRGQKEAAEAAESRASQEADSARAQFENEFGAPPEAFQKHEPQKPQFEQPQRIPEEIKKYLNDAEILPIYCATARWKTGEFFSAMNALEKIMIPAMQKAKEAIGMTEEIPNIISIKEDGQRRVDAVCNAKTLDEAEDLVQEFAKWGGEMDQKEINGFMNKFSETMNKKGDELRVKIEAAIKPIVDEEKIKVQSEIEADAKSYASKIKFDHEPSAAEIAQVRADIERYLQPKIEAKKQEIMLKVTAKVNDLKDKEAGDLIEIGKLFEGIDLRINDEIKSGLSAFDKYKQESFRLRKEAVFKVLDKNISEGMKRLDEAEKDIELAKKEDPSIKSVSEIKEELNKDRSDLDNKISLSLETGDEVGFQQALNDFKIKWESIRAEGERAAEQSVTKACGMALPQFEKAKVQMSDNSNKILNLRKKCEGSVTEECSQIQSFSNRFDTLSNKMNDIVSAMNMAETMCKNEGSTDRASLITLLRKIQKDGEDLKVYGSALEAEKMTAIADSAKKACAQIIPQVNAFRTEIVTNDLAMIKANIDKCANQKTDACVVINESISKFKEFNTSSDMFSKNILEVEIFCNNPTEDVFERIATTWNILKEDGETLKMKGKELLEEQSLTTSEKIICRAILPYINSAKMEMNDGIKKISDVQNSCLGKKDEKCLAINKLQDKFTNLENNTKTLLSRLEVSASACNNPQSTKPTQDFLKKVEQSGVKEEAQKIMKEFKELESLQAGASLFGKGIRIEAEDEISTKLLPKTETWHSREEINPSWRPPYFGTGVWYLSRGGEYLQYRFQAPVSGNYDIWVRDYVDNFQPAGIRRVTYYINGMKVTTSPEVSISKEKINPQKGSFGWHKIASLYKINGGSNILKVEKEKTTAGAAILDVFYITNNSSDIPPEL